MDGFHQRAVPSFPSPQAAPCNRPLATSGQKCHLYCCVHRHWCWVAQHTDLPWVFSIALYCNPDHMSPLCHESNILGVKKRNDSTPILKESYDSCNQLQWAVVPTQNLKIYIFLLLVYCCIFTITHYWTIYKCRTMVSPLDNRIISPVLLKKKRYNHEEQMVRGGYGGKYTAVETALCDVN